MGLMNLQFFMVSKSNGCQQNSRSKDSCIIGHCLVGSSILSSYLHYKLLALRIDVLLDTAWLVPLSLVHIFITNS